MHSYQGHTNFSLAISMVVAISAHIIIFASLFVLLNQPYIPVEKTVPSVTLTPSISQRTHQNEATVATAYSDRNLVSTVSESKFKDTTPTNSKPDPAPETETETENIIRPKTSPQQTSKSPTQQQKTSKTPRVSVPTTSPQQRNAPNQQQLRSLFQQAASEKTDTTEQISTKSVAGLSDYEKILLTQLSKATLYDVIHATMEFNTKMQVDYTLSLRLFSNGAIRSATLIKSSGIDKIDQLAIQTAYETSPFPPPPAEDASIEYRYQIPIIYDPFNLIKRQYENAN